VQIQTIFTGTTACVMWSVTGYGINGRGTLRGVLKLPALKETATISRAKANRWVAYVIHEVWHVIFTGPNAWKNYARNNPGMRAKLANALEDARIERSGMELGHADGFKVVGRELLEHMLLEGGMDVNPNDPRQLPWVFAVGCRGYGLKGERRLLSALDPRIAAMLKRTKAQVDAIPATIAPEQGTEAVIIIAQALYAELKALGDDKTDDGDLGGDWPVGPGGEEPDDGEPGGKEPGNPDDEREPGEYDGEGEDEGTDGEPGKSKGNPGERPLRVGDKVECPDGMKGTITAIEGDDATVAAL
jgi:hypothetical protein